MYREKRVIMWNVIELTQVMLWLVISDTDDEMKLCSQLG